MGGFCKLSSELVKSSIWSEDYPTRIVWLSFLSLKDKDGFVAGSRVSMYRICNVTQEEFDNAIKILESLDLNSRNKDNEGRRLEVVEGGWNILNHLKYREWTYSSNPDAIRMREKRKRQEQPEVVETTEVEKVEQKITPENWKKDLKISIEGNIDDYIKRVNDWIQCSPDSYSEEIFARFPEFEAEQIKKEITKSINWLKDNPEKRKPKYHRFLMNWLQRIY